MKVDDHWKGAVPQVDEWWTGDVNSPVVLLQNYQEEVERNSIYNGRALFGVPSLYSTLSHANQVVGANPTCQSSHSPNMSRRSSLDLHIEMLIPRCDSPGQIDRG